MRFSIFFRSGAQPGTSAPGEPQILLPITGVSQFGGVMPPGPEKYGTLAARWSNSLRKVMYWLGIQSKVADASQALNGSPGFSVKYGVPDAAVAPLIGGRSTR